MDLDSVLGTFNVPVLSAFFLGLLTAVAPCPMATNIAAVAYISRNVTDRKYAVITGTLYTLGRMFSYSLLGVLIIGICTEFMVLLMGRYEEEKRSGLSPRDAMVTAISKIGRAIVTTALTTLGGFGVLIASNFVMIRDFGIATVVGVFLCLIITITVMPGLIVWYDNWRSKRLSRKSG